MIRQHLLSVDLEDWYHSGRLKHFVTDSNRVSRIRYSTDRILDLLERKGIFATFFILGEIARKQPELVRKIRQKGHEIASHGYSHTPLWYLSRKDAQTEIRETNKILSDITGEKVQGFRAPHYSLDERTSWLIDILEEEGFEYDSSIFPVKTSLHGINGAGLSPYYISGKNLLSHTPGASLLEIPLTVYDAGPVRIPCTGGVYGRYLPRPVLTGLLKSIAKKRVINFYFHPWETDAGIPRLNVPLGNRLVAYYNIAGYLDKIEHLTEVFSFTSFERMKENLLIR